MALRSLAIDAGNLHMDLDGSEGVSARLAVRGTGMVPVQVQWFEGAGDGKTFRGGRTLGRAFDMPVKAEAPPHDWQNRDLVRQRFAKLASMLSIDNAPARLTLDLDPDGAGDKWWADMVRVGGGDWNWAENTDGRSFIHSVFSLEAGDPYWTSVDQQSKIITPAGVGLGLLGPGQSLSSLILATSNGLGTTELVNEGDKRAYPVWRVDAPFDQFTLVSSLGEVLQWTGAKSSGWIEVNTKEGTVVDETGANRYANLAPAPQFWSIRPGTTNVSIALLNPSGSSKVTVVWNVRREILF